MRECCRSQPPAKYDRRIELLGVLRAVLAFGSIRDRGLTPPARLRGLHDPVEGFVFFGSFEGFVAKGVDEVGPGTVVFFKDEDRVFDLSRVA